MLIKTLLYIHVNMRHIGITYLGKPVLEVNCVIMNISKNNRISMCFNSFVLHVVVKYKTNECKDIVGIELFPVVCLTT